MQLESLQIDVRPGSHWAAIDLGQSLLRRYWKPVYLAWWVPWLTLSVLLWACLPADMLPWGSLAMWWLRPMFDRLPLYILSREVFGEPVTAWQALRAWPHQLRGWARSLTWWRPIMAGRGLYVPVWQLEGARGKFATQRRRALGARGAYGTASWFGVACVHFTLVLEMALYGLVSFFLASPEEMNPAGFLVTYANNPQLLALTGHICYTLADGLIGPVYVSGCFTLYLRRRAELEGWDIELSLRRMAERLAARSTALRAKSATVGKTLAAALVCSLLWFAPQHDAQAAGCPTPDFVTDIRKARPPTHDASQTALRNDLDAVLSSDELRNWQCQTIWMPKKTQKEKPGDYAWLEKFFRWLFGDGSPGHHEGINLGAVKVTLIALLVILFAWLLWRYRGPLGQLLKVAERRPPPPEEICGFDIRPETLPDDVPAEVLALWRAGRTREALALLYRATVSRLAHDYAVELMAGYTEGDIVAACVEARRVGALPSLTESGCRQVTDLWRAAAYAARWPDDATLIGILDGWRSAFTAPALKVAA
ncbi:hypothetical protein [Andreprevotia chitinilytica]|uniref:hypothetical protein n=1 Tax=Andreprevotia chitinilytica TaxID=396808 RepID=UPI0012ECA1AA|nr:hypothetical protein [Andreprevotia chitinilytica]